MSYIMFSAKLGDKPRLDCIKYTAREVRQVIVKELFPRDGWKAAKKAGWKVVHAWVGFER